MSKVSGEKISLSDFAVRLPAEEAADARAAAAKIDDLARVGHAVEGIEQRFKPFFILGGVCMLVGLTLFFTPGLLNRWTLVGLLSVLPVVAVAYAWRVRDRTAADNQINELNKSHFLPHGGLYFPAGDGPACVIPVDYRPPDPQLEYTGPKDPRKPENHPGKGLW